MIPETPEGCPSRQEKADSVKSYKGILVDIDADMNVGDLNEGINVEDREDGLEKQQEEPDQDECLVDPCPFVWISKEAHGNYCKL